jgi:GNAT superfamily N-acetyltransferase
MERNWRIVQTSELNSSAKEQLLQLWNNAYPEGLSHKNLEAFENYLSALTNTKHFLLLDNSDAILGWAFTFVRDNEKWFAIILEENIKGRGIGRSMIETIKQSESVLNGWVIDHNNDNKKNGQPYISPLPFYVKCGFKILASTRLELDNISAVKIIWRKDE